MGRGGIRLLVTSLGRLPACKDTFPQSARELASPFGDPFPWEMGIVRHSWCRNVRSALRTFSRSRPGHPRFPSPAFVRPPVRPVAEFGIRFSGRAGERRGFLSRSRSLSLSRLDPRYPRSERSLGPTVVLSAPLIKRTWNLDPLGSFTVFR